MKNCPGPNCSEQIPDGLIFCGTHWGALPHDLKANLIYFHPDVAARRAKKNTSESTSYERLMRNALGVIELKAKSVST